MDRDSFPSIIDQVHENRSAFIPTMWLNNSHFFLKHVFNQTMTVAQLLLLFYWISSEFRTVSYRFSQSGYRSLSEGEREKKTKSFDTISGAGTNNLFFRLYVLVANWKKERSYHRFFFSFCFMYVFFLPSYRRLSHTFLYAFLPSSPFSREHHASCYIAPAQSSLWF